MVLGVKTLVECSLVCLHDSVQYNCQQAKGSSDLLCKVRVPSCKPFSKDLRGHPSLLVSTICDRSIIHINILEITWPKTLAYDKEFTFISSCQS